MTKRVKNISVFAIVSCIVYLFTAIESSPLLVGRFTFDLYFQGQTHSYSLPGINVVLTIIFSIIALRLYLHAWGVDESQFYKKLLVRDKVQNSKLQLGIEWIIRIIWVLMITYLPSIFANEKIILFNIDIDWEIYFIAIFAFIFIWDLIMMNDIISNSQYVTKDEGQKEHNVKELKKIWIRYDIYLLILSILIGITDFITLNGDYINYKTPIFFIMITAMVCICLVQLSKWGYEIYYNLVMN